jgi:hypothetical protein
LSRSAAVKRVIPLIALSLASLTVAACGDDDDDAPDTTEAAATETEAAGETEAADETEAAGEDSVDAIRDQVVQTWKDTLGLDDEQANCRYDASPDLDRSDQAALQEAFEECDIDMADLANQS